MNILYFIRPKYKRLAQKLKSLYSYFIYKKYLIQSEDTTYMRKINKNNQNYERRRDEETGSD